MKKLWHHWVALLSRRERATSLALFRMAVAAVMATTIVTMIHSGLVDVLWIDQREGGMLPLASGSWIIELAGGPRRGVVWPLVAVALALCAAMAVGLGGRVMVLAAVWSYRALSSIGMQSGGYDAVILNAGWLLFLSSSTATLSLDCRWKTGRWISDREVPAWPRYLAIFQLVVIYTFTGAMKTSASWTFADGYSALYWFLQDPTWTRFDMGWAAHVYPLTQLATALVWHFELLAPVLLVILHYRATAERPGRLRALFNRFDLRLGWVAFGISMHLGIFVLLDVGPFSWITMAYYLCLFCPAELEDLGRRLAARLPRRRGRLGLGASHGVNG